MGKWWKPALAYVLLGLGVYFLLPDARYVPLAIVCFFGYIVLN